MMLSETTGHSAKVEIRLRVQGMVLNVAQVGEESLILRDQCELPPCYGLIEIVVDGHLDRYPIYLHAGITPGSKFIDFRNVPAGLLDERQALLFDDDKAIPGCPF
jgi:hypothetical protein